MPAIAISDLREDRRLEVCVVLACALAVRCVVMSNADPECDVGRGRVGLLLLAVEVLVFFSAAVAFALRYHPRDGRKQLLTLVLILLQPSQLLAVQGGLDCSVVPWGASLGLALWAVVAVMAGQDSLGTCLLVLASGVNRVVLWHYSPAFVLFLLAKHLRALSSSWYRGGLALLRVLLVSGIAAAVTWLPFRRWPDSLIMAPDSLMHSRMPHVIAALSPLCIAFLWRRRLWQDTGSSLIQAMSLCSLCQSILSPESSTSPISLMFSTLPIALLQADLIPSIGFLVSISSCVSVFPLVPPSGIILLYACVITLYASCVFLVFPLPFRRPWVIWTELCLVVFLHLLHSATRSLASPTFWPLLYSRLSLLSHSCCLLLLYKRLFKTLPPSSDRLKISPD